MHIGFITSHYPFHDAKSVGGIGTAIKNLSVELISLGHQVSVFVYGQHADLRISEDGISIQRIKNIKFKGLSWLLTRKKIQRAINTASQIKRIDVVEAPDWEGITSFITLNCPIVLRLNGSDAYFCHLDQRKPKFWTAFQEKRALVNADAVISVSQFTGELTNAIFGLRKDFTVIPNGVDSAVFTPVAGKVDLNNILYFGGIIRKKGLLEIPHYFNLVVKRFPQANLLLVGKDMPDITTGHASTQQMMEALFSEAAIKNVEFVGSVPYQNIKKYIGEAAVCIFPSYAEALPVSWLEAMALEKAVVASNIGWSNEIIDQGFDGFKVAPQDHQEFADKILLLLQDENLRREIEKNARDKITRKFSTQVTALQTLDFYNETIKKNA